MLIETTRRLARPPQFRQRPAAHPAGPFAADRLWSRRGDLAKYFPGLVPVLIALVPVDVCVDALIAARLVVLVTAASIQDRDGGRLVLDKARMRMPSIALVWADGGYAGRCVDFARRLLRITLQIVKKPEGQHTFEVLPRRWVVERTLSWLVRCRRLDHDYERLPEHSEAMVKWAMIGLMTRRLAPAPGRRPWQPATPS